MTGGLVANRQIRSLFELHRPHPDVGLTWPCGNDAEDALEYPGGQQLQRLGIERYLAVDQAQSGVFDLGFREKKLAHGRSDTVGTYQQVGSLDPSVGKLCSDGVVRFLGVAPQLGPVMHVLPEA